MMLKPTLPCLALCLVSLLSFHPAIAELPSETCYLGWKEIAPTVLRDAIGAVSVWRGQVEDAVPTGSWMLATFERKGGNSFASGPKVPVEQTRPVSGWDSEGQALRQYPVVQRAGLFVLAVLDARSDRRAWLRIEKKQRSIDYLRYAGLTEPEAYRDQTIELFRLARGLRRLYSRPMLGAPYKVLSETPGSRNYVGDDLKVVAVRGNFAQVAKILGPDKLSEPLGWVEIRDREGRITIWYV
jgi:hypothetical protein